MKASSSQYFEIVDYYNASNLEEFIQSCCEMIQEIEIHNKSYSKDFSFQNSSFKITYLLTGSCHIARFINSHLILLESKNVEDETIKLVSACFQIALKGVPIPFFYNLKLDGWFSGFLELNDRSISFAVRCAYGYIKDDQWFQLFREKLELNDPYQFDSIDPIKLSLVKTFRLTPPSGQTVPMHSIFNSANAPFIPSGPLQDIVNEINLTSFHNNLLVHKNKPDIKKSCLDADELRLSLSLEKIESVTEDVYSNPLYTLSSTIANIIESQTNEIRQKSIFSTDFSSRIDPNDVNDVFSYIFQSKIEETDVQKTPTSHTDPQSTATLASKISTKTAPINSLLWHICLKVMDAASPTPFLQQKTSFKLFLNTVWSEFILKLKEYWNSGLFIPHVYISRSELSIPKSLSEFCSIDLNTSILYQKLQLLQACILVKWKRGGYGAVDRYQSILNERLEAEKIAALKDETIRRKSSVAEFGKRIFGLHSGRSLEGIIENAGKIILDASNELEQIQDGAIEIAAEYGNIQQIGLNALLSQRNSWTSDKSWEKIHSTDDSELFIDISDQVFIPERDSDNKIIGAGRLEQSGKLSDGSPLYIPETQDHGYMTIEMITKQQEIFENLGVSSEAAQERAKMQSVQLLSDMEAFKAANPTSQLLDFVQWHSPRDIILVDGNPSLSTRMEDPHNIWNRLWNRVIGIPSRSQTSLFDYESHANETFNELENLDVISNLLPTFLLIAYHVLVTHPTLINIPVLKTHVKEIGTLLSNHNWDSQSDLINIVNLINSVEKKIGIAISMLQKFPEEYNLVERLLSSLDYSTTVKMTEKSNVIKFFFDNDGKVVDFCTLSNQEMTLEQVIEEEDGYGGNRMRIESDFLDKKYRITEGTCLYHL